MIRSTFVIQSHELLNFPKAALVVGCGFAKAGQGSFGTSHLSAFVDDVVTAWEGGGDLM